MWRQEPISARVKYDRKASCYTRTEQAYTLAFDSSGVVVLRAVFLVATWRSERATRKENNKLLKNNVSDSATGGPASAVKSWVRFPRPAVVGRFLSGEETPYSHLRRRSELATQRSLRDAELRTSTQKASNSPDENLASNSNGLSLPNWCLQ